MHADYLGYSYNPTIRFPLPVYSTPQNYKNATTVMSVFRNDLEEKVHSEIFSMAVKQMLHQHKNVHIHQEAEQWSLTFQNTSNKIHFNSINKQILSTDYIPTIVPDARDAKMSKMSVPHGI